MNGYLWHVIFVNPNDPRLVDRTNTLRIATTDPVTSHVYISEDLYGVYLAHVLTHELGHCVMISFGLLTKIHKMVQPRYWIEAEEWICNFIADYGMGIFYTLYSILGYNAIDYIPQELERLIFEKERYMVWN